MSLELKINDDIKAAMLARDAAKLEALRAIKAALLLEKAKEGVYQIVWGGSSSQFLDNKFV